MCWLLVLAVCLALPSSTTVVAAGAATDQGQDVAVVIPDDGLVRTCSVNDNGKALLDCVKSITTNGTQIRPGCCIRLWRGIRILTRPEADACICGVREMLAGKGISIKSLCHGDSSVMEEECNAREARIQRRNEVMNARSLHQDLLEARWQREDQR